MCIAILNVEGTLERKILENSSDANPHGGGLCWIEDGKLKIFKSTNGFAVIKKYAKIRKNNNLPIMIHFRISTSGLINTDNCHPFFVNEDLVMCHNGVIYKMDKKSLISDTQFFINNILQKLPVEFLNSYGLKVLLQDYIGGNNKLVFLDKFGIYHIMNEEKGHWDKENNNWFSNHSYVEAKKYKFNKKGKVVGVIVENMCSICKDLECQNCDIYKTKMEKQEKTAKKLAEQYEKEIKSEKRTCSCNLVFKKN